MLQTGFLRRNRLKTLIHEENGWYSNEAFARILRRERQRSDRSNSPFSYVLFDLSTAKTSYPKFHCIWDELLKLVTDSTRDYDVKHLPGRYKIGVLLLDTDISNAKLFIERISKNLNEYFESRMLEDATRVIRSIKISSHPINRMPEYLHEIEGKPVLIRDVAMMTLLRDDRKEHVTFHEKQDVFMNWNVNTTPSGALAITAPDFWDITHQYWKYASYQYIKRGIDILGSLFWLIMFAPALLTIALIVKLTSKGPVFFIQERMGHLGRGFPFLKFRTMYTNSDTKIHEEYVKKLINGNLEEINKGTDDSPMYKLTDDPRITPIGKYLRALSLDELPQLINVLKGDMSLVGPRPPIRYEVEAYQNWHYRRISEVKPGITGLWQVTGRNQTTFDEMVRLDIQYAENWSLDLDIKIMIRTLFAVFGAEGN